MEHEAVALRAVPDDELLLRLAAFVSQSRRVEPDLVAHIGEADERRLYARQAFPSMFAYCTQALHLSEAEAYRRITVARAARRHPELLAALRDGRVHLSSLALLVPLVAEDNCARLLDRAEHGSKREIEELVAELAPRPDVPSGIRKLPKARMVSGGASMPRACDEHGNESDSSPTAPMAQAEPSERAGLSDPYSRTPPCPPNCSREEFGRWLSPLERRRFPPSRLSRRVATGFNSLRAASCGTSSSDCKL